MERRGFLGRLAIAAGLPFVFIKGAAATDAIEAPPTYNNTILTDAWVIKAFAYEFRQSLRRMGHVTRLGEGRYSGQDGSLRQFNVTIRDFGPMYDPKQAIYRYIKPAAETMAETIRHKRIRTVFQIDGPYAVPHIVSHFKSENHGLAIRMVKAHQIEIDEDWIRFDVLGRA